ncbi:DUF1254 domain-containing protein [Galbibacter pacificus]|uniref:DUF1254 domain-containing protein n=1 Tax=Galbibacter pacificus TaxID=2996052 RepID=A0ABT6FRZ9_9FLAO|nr:DUF1254 domain-containing protein [Galbibacter pacificus]MDG3582831.1 DUF1254 domain-containing protein [Galbibacter pacificus]MDG3586050.1 DUF1254 domain-containing protein [Galbibacter pacificus]
MKKITMVFLCISTFLGCVQNKTEEKQTASSSSTENGGSHYEQLASLPFESGYPTEENSSKILADELYFQRATQVYLWALPAVNMYAMKEGLGKTFGEGYNVISVFEKRLKPNTVITTPNSDVIYALGFADLSKTGPLVLDVPPMLQGLLDDYWHRPLQGPKRPDGTHFLGDIGFPGPDKGKGGKYIVVPEGYKGKVPNGYFVYTSKTNGVFIFQRGFFKSVDNLEPGIKGVEGIKVYPLEGEAKPMDFQHASDIDSYALFSHDASYFEMLDRFIQSDKVDDVDPYMHGMLAAIGIKKGKKFSPSAHEKELLDKAAETAWRMAKNISANFDEEKDGIWWKDRKWVAHAHTKIDDFMHTLLDEEFRDRETGHVDVNAKAHMYVNHYSISTGMMSSIVGLGAKYGNAYKDSDGNYLMGENTYKITFPPNPPAKLFWSLTLYDAATASGVDAEGQEYPSLNSMNDLVKNDDGSFTFWVGPKKPDGNVNWLKTVPGKGWFSLFRFYGPDQAFFDREYKVGDFEKVE